MTDCLQVMQSGTELVKLRTNVRQFRRFYTLDADMVINGNGTTADQPTLSMSHLSHRHIYDGRPVTRNRIRPEVSKPSPLAGQKANGLFSCRGLYQRSASGMEHRESQSDRKHWRNTGA